MLFACFCFTLLLRFFFCCCLLCWLKKCSGSSTSMAYCVEPATRTLPLPTLKSGGIAVGWAIDGDVRRQPFWLRALHCECSLPSNLLLHAASAMTWVVRWLQLAHGCWVHDPTGSWWPQHMWFDTKLTGVDHGFSPKTAAVDFEAHDPVGKDCADRGLQQSPSAVFREIHGE